MLLYIIDLNIYLNVEISIRNKSSKGLGLKKGERINIEVKHRISSNFNILVSTMKGLELIFLASFWLYEDFTVIEKCFLLTFFNILSNKRFWFWMVRLTLLWGLGRIEGSEVLDDIFDGFEGFEHFLVMASALLRWPWFDMLAHHPVKVELSFFWNIALN